MSFDMSHLLEQWDYQPGQVMVRKFKGKDGAQKIQLRVDLGLLQMNAEGRPDGKRPLGHESFYAFCVHKLELHREEHGDEEAFRLKADDCSRLQAEALQFHHRCICQLQLEDYEAAARDSSRNLEVFDFADEYAETDDMSWSLRQFHPQVLMLNVRAAASTHLHTSNYKKAIKEIEEGLEELKQFYESCGNTEYADQSPEFLSLETWLEDVKNQRPLSKREKLELDLQKAIQLEDFEKAAKVRDALRKLEKTKKS